MTSRMRLKGATLALAASLALVAGRAGAAPGDVKSLGKELKRAVAAQEETAIQQALEGLIDAGGAEALDTVLKLIPKLGRAGDSVYWQLVSAGAGFRDSAALRALGEFVVKKDKDPYVRDLLFALENNSSPNVVDALRPILLTGPYDLQLMAADQLARVRTVASADLMVEALEKEGDQGDPEIKRRLLTSLNSITGQSMGDPINWIGWWKANRDKGLPDIQHNDGAGSGLASKVLDPNRQREFESITRSPNRILVLSGRLPDDDPNDPGRDHNYDHMEQVLDRMEIAHTVVLKAEFEKDPDKYLKDAWTILVNCNNINSQCICKECRRLIADPKNRTFSGNRMFRCPDNCPQGHVQHSYRLQPAAVEKLKQWVESGGYLFTEDWGLVEIEDVAWPKLVSSHKGSAPAGGGGGGTAGSTLRLIRALSDKKDPNSIQQGGHMDVLITPGRGMTSHPLMRGVFARPRPPTRESDGQDEGGTKVRDLGTEENPTVAPQHQWMVDDESPQIQVQDRANVTVLLESQELAEITEGDEAVAVTFRVGSGRPKPAEPADRPVTGAGDGITGKSRARGEFAERQAGGRVLHVLSHFGKQQGSQRDTFVLQNLILNFIMESNRQHQ